MKELDQKQMEAVAGGSWIEEIPAIYDAVNDFVDGFKKGYANSDARQL